MKRWIAAAAVVLAALSPACKDRGGEAAAEPAGAAQEPQAAAEPQGDDTLPPVAEIRAQLLPVLAVFPAVQLGELQVESAPAEEGGVVLALRVQAVVGENLYTQEAAPEMLNEERKAANDAMNRAMLPESHYLLQVGAGAGAITEADRKLTPLPQELQALADELRQLAEGPVYHLHTPAGTLVEMPATLRAVLSGGQWEFSGLSFDTADLRALVGAVPQSALPQGAAIVREGYEEQQRQLVRDKVAAFAAAAAPYISGREDAARRRALELQARQEEEAQAAAEQAAARAACEARWEQACAERLKEGAVFSGEWTRGDAFGKLALRLARVQRLAGALQFVGVLYDPDLPQAEIQIVGRCEAPSAPEAPVGVTVHLYNGRYDPDQPTAEVYDAKDGLLRMQLAEDGMLTGEMTCQAWAETPEKAFALRLSHTPPKSGGRRPARARN